MQRMTVECLAPAKINLALHVTGKRADGYHLLDMLVAFGPVADRVSAMPSGEWSFDVIGPYAADVPAGLDNLAMRAAKLAAPNDPMSITLDKQLPAMSGIGGGSADAAATLRAMAQLARYDLPSQTADWADGDLSRRATEVLALGADVPMCVLSRGLRARRTGELLTPVALPDLPVVLVNPRVPVSTPAVFRALDGQFGAPMPETPPDFGDAADLIAWLATQRNDLQAPACQLAPAIAKVLDHLRQTEGCALARMSGSGATCFGLYLSTDQAAQAAQSIRDAIPGWWVADGYLGDRPDWTAVKNTGSAA